MNKKLNRLWRQATADKKRFGIMLSLVCIGLLLWGRLILLEKVPRVATADPDKTEEGVEAPLTPLRDRPTVTLTLPDTLALDLFELRPDRYKPKTDPTLGEEPLQDDPGPTDEFLQRENLLEEARAMTLQGVVRSNPPFAVIDGVRVHVGETAGGFVLIDLDPQQRRVRLQSQTLEDLVVILKMSDG